MNKPAIIDLPQTSGSPRFTVAEFVRMEELGAFSDMRVDLVEGNLVKMMSGGMSHGEALVRLSVKLSEAYDGIARLGIDVMVQTGSDTIRGPDVIAVTGGAPDRGPVAASAVLLAVEVSLTTLGKDLGEKLVQYAGAGIPHYWVLDLEGATIRVMTEPTGQGYRQVASVPFGQPLAVPGTTASITLD